MYSPQMMKYLINYQKQEQKKNKKIKYFSFPKLFNIPVLALEKNKS